jgi:D-threo-aldose 1-dehydrogenase
MTRLTGHDTKLGLGTAQLGDLGGGMTDDDAQTLLQTAVDNNITYFDTAPLYGTGIAERRLGAFLEASGLSARVSTKVGRIIDAEGAISSGGVAAGEWHWDYSADGVRRSFEDSQRRLHGYPVHILLAHDPQQDMDAALATGLPELERLRADGTVPAIGIGSGDLEALRICLTRCEPDYVLVAGRLTLLEHEAGDRFARTCAARSIRVIVGGVFNSGILATNAPEAANHYEYSPAPKPIFERAAVLARLTNAYDTPLPAAALHFALRHALVSSVLLGADSAVQLRQNLDLVTEPAQLSALWQALDDAGLLAEGILEQLERSPSAA